MQNLRSLFVISSILLLVSCSKDDYGTSEVNLGLSNSSYSGYGNTQTAATTQYSLTVTAGTGGSVSTSGGTYDDGTTVTITATPNDGYEFVGWNGSDSSNSTISITKKFNYGGFLVANIFTKITPNPKEIDKSKGISDKNFEKLIELINKVDQIVYAWGNSFEEPQFLKELILCPKCFGKNLNGTPKHPLYLPSSSRLESYRD